MNTYGIGPYSVKNTAFPELQNTTGNLSFIGKNFKNILRVHNLALNILGYFPLTSPISGCVRIATGFTMFCAANFLDNKTKKELIDTSLMQMFRGALEALIIATPINIIFDILKTIDNSKIAS